MYLDHPAEVPNAWYESNFLGFKQKYVGGCWYIFCKTQKAFTLKSQVLDVAGCTTKKKKISPKIVDVIFREPATEGGFWGFIYVFFCGAI